MLAISILLFHLSPKSDRLLETLLAEACRQTGLTFEAYGHGVGNPIEDIERRCANADIVFGTARTALEAMAAGAAAVLIDGRGFGGLVTSDNFALGRRLNFGLGMLGKQPKLEMLVEAIWHMMPRTPRR